MNFRNIALAALMMGLMVGNGFGGPAQSKEKQDKEWKEKEQRVKEHEQQEKEKKFLVGEEEVLPEVKEFGIEEKPEKEIKEKEEPKALITTKNFEELKEPLVKSERIKEQVIYDNRGILWSLFGKRIKGGFFSEKISSWKQFFGEGKDIKKHLFGSTFMQEFDAKNGGHSYKVRSISVTFDGKTFVSGADDEAIRIWRFNTETGEYELKQIFDKNNDGHTDGVRSVSITSDGQVFVSGSSDKTIKVWRFNPETGEYELIQKFDLNNDGHTDDVTSVSITSDGKTFVSGSYDKTIKVWRFNPETGEYELIQKFDKNNDGHTDDVTSVSITSDGKTFVSGSYDKAIKVWRFNPEKGEYELIQTFDKNNGGHAYNIRLVFITPDGNTFVSGSWKNSIKGWRFNPKKGKQGEYELKQTFDKDNGGHTDDVSSVSVTPDGQTVVSGSWDKTIKVFTCGDDGLFKCGLTIAQPINVMSTVLSKNYTVIAGLANGTIVIYRLGDFLKTFEALSFQQLLLVIKLQRDVLKGMKNIKLEKFEERFFFTLPKVIQMLFSDVVKDYQSLSKKWNKQFDIENFKDLKIKRLEREEKQKGEMLKKEEYKKKMAKRQQEELEELQKQIKGEEEAKIKLKMEEESPYLKELKKKLEQLEKQGFVEPEEEKNEKKSEGFMEEVD